MCLYSILSHNRKLQVLQNQVCKLLLENSQRVGYLKQNLSTKDLLHTTGYLSIHQLGALSTVVMIKKILLSGKPSYLADRLMTQTSQTTRSGTTIDPKSTSLNLKRSSFLYRGTKLFNQLPDVLRTENKIRLFKKEAKLWVKQKIPVKPWILNHSKRDRPRGTQHLNFLQIYSKKDTRLNVSIG